MPLANGIIEDPRYRQYMDDLDNAQAFEEALERIADEITGDELKAKAYEILTVLARYSSGPNGREAKGLLDELMGVRAEEDSP